MTPRRFKCLQFRKGTLDFNFECINLLQNDFCKQRYITLNATISGKDRIYPKTHLCRTFFAEYIIIISVPGHCFPLNNKRCFQNHPYSMIMAHLDISKMPHYRTADLRLFAYAGSRSFHAAAQTIYAPCKHVRVMYIPPYTPLLYRKTWVYRGDHFFSYFCSKTLILGTR